MLLRVTFDDVQQKGTDSGGDIIYYYNDQPFTGIIGEIVNDVLVGESEFADGHRGGIQRLYYANGQMAEEYTIRFNKMEGPFTEWDEHGNVLSITHWERGLQIL